MKAFACTLILLQLFLFPALCVADDYGPSTLQCPSGLVSIGDKIADVLSNCGTPASRSPAFLQSETMTYNFGPTDFIYTMRFEGGQLVQIVQGDRGD